MASLERDYQAAVTRLRDERAGRLRAVAEAESIHVVAMDHGELVAPVLDKELTQRLLLCASLATCEALERAAIAAIDERYPKASEEYRLRAARVLSELPPSKRIVAYERILAHGQNIWATTRADGARAAIQKGYREAVRAFADHYSAGVAESETLRDAELAEEEERVARENSETAASVVKGIAVAALIVAASRGGGGSGQSSGRSTKTLVVCGHYGSDLRGCCSSHIGVDTSASSRYQIMCLDGLPSPTCECR